jgi:hypothetical protein
LLSVTSEVVPVPASPPPDAFAVVFPAIVLWMTRVAEPAAVRIPAPGVQHISGYPAGNDGRITILVDSSTISDQYDI